MKVVESSIEPSTAVVSEPEINPVSPPPCAVMSSPSSEVSTTGLNTGRRQFCGAAFAGLAAFCITLSNAGPAFAQKEIKEQENGKSPKQKEEETVAFGQQGFAGVSPGLPADVPPKVGAWIGEQVTPLFQWLVASTINILSPLVPGALLDKGVDWLGGGMKKDENSKAPTKAFGSFIKFIGEKNILVPVVSIGLGIAFMQGSIPLPVEQTSFGGTFSILSSIVLGGYICYNKFNPDDKGKKK